MKNLQRLVGVLVIAASFVIGWWWMSYQQFVEQPLALPEQGVIYQLEPGTSIGTLAADLEARGWIEQGLFLRILARLQGPFSIKAGEYRLRYGLTPPSLLRQFETGKVVLYSQMLLEGSNYREMLAAVRANTVLEQRLPDDRPETLMAAIGEPERYPEGLFFPDTYHFPRGTSDIDFLRRARARMRHELQLLWSQRAPDLPLKSPYEALILASIVEKETGKAEERAQIAGVFVRRLKRGMKLQTDPTVIYGMGEDFDGNLRRKDLRTDTPYNTYVHRGLPPTPICMPSRAAIEAALHPADGKALYFVARGDGSHKFSATLKEHNQAVRKYQLKRK